jgi:DNA repair exonuclease SbcCD ATPase subunit
MRLLNIQWRNIKSYGNKLQKITFDPDGGLWNITAPNGYGKSTVLELPKILFYGKLDKFKKEDIANRLNRHGWIKGEIEVKPGVNVTIERKLAPTSLSVEKNGVDIGKAGISNYQDYIDNEVIGLPYHIFSNIISLSVNDFKSFVSMTPGDKRIIIDKLFSMEIINKMNDLVRKDLRATKIDMDLFDREIMSLNVAIKTAKTEFDKLQEKIKINNTNRISEISAELLKFKPKLEEAEEKVKTYRTKELDIKKANQVFHKQRADIESALRELKRKDDLYKKDVCPTCETPFSEKRFELIRGDLDEQLQYQQKQLIIIRESENKYNTALHNITDAIKTLNDFIIQVKTAYNTLYNELTKLKGDKPKELDSIKSIISKNTTTIKKKESKKSDLDTDLKYLAILEDLYSDSGVKKKILESYLPTLNREVEYTLGELHFPYRLKFNNDFEPNLQHLGFDISVDTLSTGEKKRVDLAVLISIIRMIKRKYPTLNIFMLDEVLSSIDSDGIYDIIGLLKHTAKEMAINIFIINHTPLPIEHFSYRMEISKSAGFSDLAIEKLSQE